MALTRIGPARVPSRESPETAIELLQERGYTACEIDFEGKFWMDYPWAERFGELAREADIALSVHAPIAGFMGHLERDKKYNMATGMLDHSAGVAVDGVGLGAPLPPRHGDRRRIDDAALDALGLEQPVQPEAVPAGLLDDHDRPSGGSLDPAAQARQQGEQRGTVARGDHTVFVAEVVSAGVRDSSKVPLVLRSTGLNYGG